MHVLSKVLCQTQGEQVFSDLSDWFSSSLKSFLLGLQGGKYILHHRGKKIFSAA